MGGDGGGEEGIGDLSGLERRESDVSPFDTGTSKVDRLCLFGKGEGNGMSF